MSKIVTTMSLFIAILLFTANALPGEYPAGIASIKLGDSKRTVYEKMVASDDIKTQSNGYKNWLGPGYSELVHNHSIDDKDKIDLFDKEFKIRWEFSKRDKLYRIIMTARISKELFPKIEKKKVSEFCKLVVEQYSYKYGEPYKINLKAYPVSPEYMVSPEATRSLDDMVSVVAKWRFPSNDSLLLIYLEIFPFDTVGRKKNVIYFCIDLSESKETLKVLLEDSQSEKLKKLDKERDQRIRHHKKSRDLL